jgi:hypothetical protein
MTSPLEPDEPRTIPATLLDRMRAAWVAFNTHEKVNPRYSIEARLKAVLDRNAGRRALSNEGLAFFDKASVVGNTDWDGLEAFLAEVEKLPIEQQFRLVQHIAKANMDAFESNLVRLL